MKQETKQQDTAKRFILSQDGETLEFEGDKAECFADYESEKDMYETETFFDWCKNSYPCTKVTPQDTSTRKDELGITNAPFTFSNPIAINNEDNPKHLFSVYGNDGMHIFDKKIISTKVHEVGKTIKAICTAVNETYGKGYNPAAMEELYKALAEIVEEKEQELRAYKQLSGESLELDPLIKSAKTALHNANANPIFY